VLSITRAEATYTLATALPAGTHTVELFKLTEAAVGISQFKGFDFSGGTLLPPPPQKTRHLEFLGDSASNGYGIEGASAACSFTAATENAHKAFPALVANDLGADHHNLAVSGKGLYWNYYRPDTDVFAILYPRILPFTMGSVFDFNEYTPDLVWMTLGGNDYDEPNPGDPPPPFSGFKASYDTMVTNIRSKRPNAHIVCAVAPSLQDSYPVGSPVRYNAYTNVKNAATSVVADKVAGGDTKIYVFEFTRSTNADLTACSFHPNAAKHRAMADEAITFIKGKTGWP
jgi:lysophospholipase L1-like esterase